MPSGAFTTLAAAPETAPAGSRTTSGALLAYETATGGSRSTSGTPVTSRTTSGTPVASRTPPSGSPQPGGGLSSPLHKHNHQVQLLQQQQQQQPVQQQQQQQLDTQSAVHLLAMYLSAVVHDFEHRWVHTVPVYCARMVCIAAMLPRCTLSP